MTVIAMSAIWKDATSHGRRLWSRRVEVRRLAAHHGALNVRVFGSVARGDSGPDSDIDLLVDFDTRKNDPQTLEVLADKLSALLSIPVDVSCDLTMSATPYRQALREARKL